MSEISKITKTPEVMNAKARLQHKVRRKAAKDLESQKVSWRLAKLQKRNVQ